MLATPHPRQAERLAALRALNILDTPREEKYDRIVELVAELCGVPIAVINLIDEHRQWFKAEVGLGVRETPLETSICAHVILQPGITVIEDTLNDPRLQDNSVCIAEPGLRFYAGALLKSENGLPIGTLCVLDYQPREFTDPQRRILGVLADQVTAHIMLTRELGRTRQLLAEVDHRVKNSLSIVGALLGFQARGADDGAVKDALNRARDRVMAVAAIHEQLHVSESVERVQLHEFLYRITDALKLQANENVAIKADVARLGIGARDAVNIGIIVNEMVTNALRHGFPNDRSGTVSVEGAAENGRLRITIADDGVGLPEGFHPEAMKGLGMRLTTSIANGFGTPLVWSTPEAGASFSFYVPLDAAQPL